MISSSRMERILVVATTGADPEILGVMSDEERALFEELAAGPRNVDVPFEVPDIFVSGLSCSPEWEEEESHPGELQ